jgi:hypothetical protein
MEASFTLSLGLISCKSTVFNLLSFFEALLYGSLMFDWRLGWLMLTIHACTVEVDMRLQA